MIQLIASFLLIAAGLYLAVLADVADGSDMQTFGWIIVAAGILGVIANIVFSRIGQGRDQP